MDKICSYEQKCKGKWLKIWVELLEVEKPETLQVSKQKLHPPFLPFFVKEDIPGHIRLPDYPLLTDGLRKIRRNERGWNILQSQSLGHFLERVHQFFFVVFLLGWGVSEKIQPEITMT